MSTINNSDIVQQIKDKLDILDVVSRTVILKKKGQNYWGLCPFHKEKTPSFSVNPSKGIYKCFSCGEGGDVLSFLMKTQNKSFMDVIRDEAQALGIELPANFGGASAEKKEIKQQILNLYNFQVFLYNFLNYFLNHFYNKNNIKIVGGGIIDGSTFERDANKNIQSIPYDFNYCNNITFKGIATLDPAGWCYNIYFCKDVYFDNIKIINSWNKPQ